MNSGFSSATDVIRLYVFDCEQHDYRPEMLTDKVVGVSESLPYVVCSLSRLWNTLSLGCAKHRCDNFPWSCRTHVHDLI